MALTLKGLVSLHCRFSPSRLVKSNFLQLAQILTYEMDSLKGSKGSSMSKYTNSLDELVYKSPFKHQIEWTKPKENRSDQYALSTKDLIHFAIPSHSLKSLYSDFGQEIKEDIKWQSYVCKRSKIQRGLSVDQYLVLLMDQEQD